MANLLGKREPTPFDLKTFGLIAAIVFGFIGFVVSRRVTSLLAPAAIWGLGTAFVVIYYAVPNVRRLFYLGWQHAFYPVGWLVSHALLAFVYYLVLTPIGLLMRLAGRDPMQRRLDRSAATYWLPHPTETDTSRYFRQF